MSRRAKALVERLHRLVRCQNGHASCGAARLFLTEHARCFGRVRRDGIHQSWG
jgi:hypothetical protein